MANQGPREVSSGSFYSNKSMSKSKRPHTRKPFGISNRSTSAVTDVPLSLTQQRVSTSHNLSGSTHSSLPREYTSGMSLGSISNDLEDQTTAQAVRRVLILALILETMHQVQLLLRLFKKVMFIMVKMLLNQQQVLAT